MNKILEKEFLTPQVFRMKVEAPAIARKRKAGQFIILRASESGERIPLTIADGDADAGWIELVVQAVGKTTADLSRLEPGGNIPDLAGPLGRPTHIEKYGTVVMVGGGIGIAPSHPIAQAMKAAGNRVISILGGRTKDLVIMEQKMRAASDEVIITTDDGSYGTKGLVTDAIKKLVSDGVKIDLVIAIGPPVMMKFVSLLTKEYDIPTMVSLNTIMVDGTGMCGGCRVTVGNESKFVCVDGPEFDGHLVNFDEMMQRLSMYREHEKQSNDHACKIGLDKQ
ncbi:MAG TPA: sulfide/dihydroorotate dehydrogenase-like FAD/NAD-binding protein [Spirochaetota bacterium]|nr:sulfide/dihydroorotate dehydrogenase-like FAD/NAD-binding protein [Spirochaetota bacterium]HOD16571.1 sulfide/dihydroorotate dehydrogenase-like FAD/NAD-binding protein [Spirochaetota bacterium]HPG52293.1 sulfide/dihydroorotate dehydrogenase-like FAD/NAD-binding protein [Spirochaetota bacterium]HPN14396.1 sulfide/dihydroorotate dehydrogenase-like FAD/NAD-binding protein [Spirochaetota bacterium]HQL81421.1 sulfide/dihydroorotate dehydrogenase-like FAD/NAD-binding protein [Spirochaetota bacteri